MVLIDKHTRIIGTYYVAEAKALQTLGPTISLVLLSRCHFSLYSDNCKAHFTTELSVHLSSNCFSAIETELLGQLQTLSS